MHRVGRVRPGDDQLAIGRTDQEEMERAGVHSDGDRELELAHRRRDLGRTSKILSHLDGCGGRLLCVIRAGEQQEQRIAPELQQLSTATGGDAEHAAEHAAQRLDEFLGADSPSRGQALGQGGEAGDVGEHHRALDDSPATFGLVGHPIEHETRHEAVEVPPHLDFLVLNHRPVQSPAPVSPVAASFGPCMDSRVAREPAEALRPERRQLRAL